MTDPLAVYVIRQDYHDYVQDVRLRNIEWSVLFSLNGQRNLHQVADKFGLTGDVMDSIITTLAGANLIYEKRVKLDEYLINIGQGPQAESTTTLEQFLAREEPAPPASNGHSNGTPRAEIKRFMRLGGAVDFIVSESDDTTAGQIAVYRAFLKVPAEILHRNGIRSLSLVHNETLIEDPELQDAIASAVRDTLSVELPESVYEERPAHPDSGFSFS